MQVDGKMKDALRLATQHTLSMFGKLLSVNIRGQYAILFQSRITLAKNARLELQPGIQVNKQCRHGIRTRFTSLYACCAHHLCMILDTCQGYTILGLCQCSLALTNMISQSLACTNLG